MEGRQGGSYTCIVEGQQGGMGTAHGDKGDLVPCSPTQASTNLVPRRLSRTDIEK